MKLITHAGLFHADEVFGTAILQMLYPCDEVQRVARVTDDMVTNDTIIYDIGGGRYDHHQKGGNGVRENGVPYASAGLLWRDFGRDGIANCYDGIDPEGIDFMWEYVDRTLIQGIDAHDCGVLPRVDYAAQPMTVSEIVSGYNPTWDSTENKYTAFMNAVDFAENVLSSVVDRALSLWSAKTLVKKAVDGAKNHIMVMNTYAPYGEFTKQSDGAAEADILYAVYPSNRTGWSVAALTVDGQPFQNRKPFPEAWRGLRDDDLRRVTGISTAIFCHPAGFMCAAETKEDAIALANLAVDG